MAINSHIRSVIVESELRSLREFGYESLTEAGLFDGGICTMFFKSHLADAIEQAAPGDVLDTLEDVLSGLERILAMKQPA